MANFFDFLKTSAVCGTVFFVVMLVLLSLPKSRLRSVGLQCMKYALAAVLFILVPSPVDAIPDVIPGICHLDDLGYIVGGIAAIRSANRDRRQRAFEQECENLILAKQAGYELSDEQEEMVRAAEEHANARS